MNYIARVWSYNGLDFTMRSRAEHDEKLAGLVEVMKGAGAELVMEKMVG